MWSGSLSAPFARPGSVTRCHLAERNPVDEPRCVLSLQPGLVPIRQRGARREPCHHASVQSEVGGAEVLAVAVRPVHSLCGADVEQWGAREMRDDQTSRLSSSGIELHTVVAIGGQCGEDGSNWRRPAMEGVNIMEWFHVHAIFRTNRHRAGLRRSECPGGGHLTHSIQHLVLNRVKLDGDGRVSSVVSRAVSVQQVWRTRSVKRKMETQQCEH